jgi:hypothetical protein
MRNAGIAGFGFNKESMKSGKPAPVAGTDGLGLKPAREQTFVPALLLLGGGRFVE